jgi:hypothetical protein
MGSRVDKKKNTINIIIMIRLTGWLMYIIIKLKPIESNVTAAMIANWL